MLAWATSLFFLFVFVLIPWAILVGGFALLLRAQRSRPQGFSSVTARSLIGSAIATLAFNIWVVVAIFSSSSSTASIGFAFLPLYSFAAAAVAWATGWALLTLLAFARSGGPASGPRSWTAGVGAVLFLAALVTGSTLAWQRPSLLNSASQPDMPPARLAEITEQALAGSDYDVLARLAENPEVTIRASVARNPQTPAAIAEKLASDPESSVRHWVITHPGLSHETLERLAADRDEIVRRNATAALGRVSGKLE